MNFLVTHSPIYAEIFLLVMVSVILIADLFIVNQTKTLTYLLVQFTLLGCMLITVATHKVGIAYLFNHMFVDDLMSDVLKMFTYLAVAMMLVYSRSYLMVRGLFTGEFLALVLFATLGMMVMISASNFLTLYLGLELLALSLYTLVALQRDSATATEAAMKYFILGAMASGFLLYGMSMLYGATGSLDVSHIAEVIRNGTANKQLLVFGLAFIVAGLAFKLGAVPFHMWVPDVYHGAPTAVALYIGTAPKLAGFALFLRLLVGGLEPLAGSWQAMLIIIALLSMAVGNIVAIAQDNIKRMLAYSSISHMGFFLLGILSAGPNGYGSSLFYILVYAIMSAGSFGMIILLSRAGFEAERLEDFKGLNQRSPWHAFLMMLLMLSMAGVPPTAGFYAKLLVIQSVIQADMIWLAVAAVLLAVIGAYYYLRVIKLMYFDDATEHAPIRAGWDVQALLGFNALLLVGVLPWVGVIMELCRQAIKTLS